MATRPEPDPRARGFLRAWVSRARLWSATTRHHLRDGAGLGETFLGLVAFYLCLKDVCLLIEGRPRVPHDAVARDDCPIDPRELRKLRDRAVGFRDEVLHLSDKEEEGRELKVHWTADPPKLRFESTVGHKSLDHDSITRPEIYDVLDVLDPWLRKHWERLIEEERPDPNELRAKIEATMKAINAGTSDDPPELPDPGSTAVAPSG